MGTHKSLFCPLVLIREPKILRERSMTGLVKLHCSGEAAGERREWAVRDIDGRVNEGSKCSRHRHTADKYVVLFMNCSNAKAAPQSFDLGWE